VWSAEEVLERNRGYEVPGRLPGFFGFGSNGGGELLAFDMRRGQACPVVAIPFVPMDAEEAIAVSESFAAFQGLMGIPWESE